MKIIFIQNLSDKRFSLEGGETLIPALDQLISRSSQLGVDEVVLGMAHRGRLNVLTNIFGKSYKQIFSEFEGKEFEEDVFSGDVKYHLGSSKKLKQLQERKFPSTLPRIRLTLKRLLLL